MQLVQALVDKRELAAARGGVDASGDLLPESLDGSLGLGEQFLKGALVEWDPAP
jgi:hypothetical protein